MLSAAARAHIDLEVARWRLSITLPIERAEVAELIRPIALNLVALYGIEALAALKDSATHVIGQGNRPRTAAEHQPADQNSEHPETPSVTIDQKIAALNLMETGELDPRVARQLLADLNRPST